jgi:thymidine kinase
VQSRERVLVGAQNAYEARCRACFDPTLAAEAGSQASTP